VTAEVAIMNQQALVFAADSATTVTMWVEGQRQTRYFKGANKLFQLSSAHPVGLMIYSSASLHHVPWEVIIKDFRKSLGSDSSEHLSGYATRFFDFVKGHAKLFPDELRKSLFIDEALRAAASNHREASESPAVRDADGDAKTTAFRAALEATRAKLRDATPQAPITPTEVDAAIAAHVEALTSRIREAKELFALPDAALADLLAEVAVVDLMANYKYYLSETGVVVGGYGDDDYFPMCESYSCYGFLDRQFICNPEGEPTQIGKDLPASIEAFATTSMIDNFRLGIAPDVFTGVQLATRRELREFAAKLQAILAPGQPTPANLETMIDEAVGNHRREWFQLAMSEHYGPLARVIASLPVQDMAALARSLVELQSLKERVTKPTESVSGPIDVAVITKHDGFVWIDRKHYFKPELNPRFFNRQSANTVGK